MVAKVVILESAEQDLNELKAYIVKNFSLATWRQSYEKIKKAIHNLKSYPYAGTVPEEIEKLNLTQFRQIISGMNRIIYEVREERVYIHAIIDTRRDLQSLLLIRLLRTKNS